MNGTEPAWLWRNAGHTATASWFCCGCDAHGALDRGAPVRAEDHVMSTGHTVYVSRCRTTTLEGVRTSADQPAV